MHRFDPYSMHDSPPQLSVVVPTMNEERNVATLVHRLDDALPSHLSWEVIFVDDSCDDTPQRVRDLQSEGLPAVLMHREPEERSGGLGGAVWAGFERAQGSVIAVMDADLQHPPERLPLMIDIVANGAVDVAIASRFAAGGAATGLDGRKRKLASQGFRYATRAMAPRVRNIRDPLSGYFALRRSVIEGVPLAPNGFKILLDILLTGKWSTAVEVPFTFGERVAGSSKADTKEALILMRKLARRSLQHPSHQNHGAESPRSNLPVIQPISTGRAS